MNQCLALLVQSFFNTAHLQGNKKFQVLLRISLMKQLKLLMIKY